MNKPSITTIRVKKAILVGFSILPVFFIFILLSYECKSIFKANLRCSSLDIYLSEGWPKGSNFPAREIHLYGVEEWSDNLYCTWNRQRDSGEPVLVRDSGTIQLDETMEPQRITMSAKDGFVTLSFKDGIKGTITGYGAASSDIIYTQWTLNPGGSISFNLRDTTEFDAVERLRFDTITFLTPEIGGDGEFGSSIQTGTIRVQGKKDIQDLLSKDYLILEDIEQGDISIRLSNESAFDVEINGKARKVEFGLAPPYIPLKPTYIEKWQDKPVWQAFVVTGGLLLFLLTILNALNLLDRTP